MFARLRPVPSAAGWAPATSAPMAIRVEARGGHATVPRAGAPCWRPTARSAMAHGWPWSASCGSWQAWLRADTKLRFTN